MTENPRVYPYQQAAEATASGPSFISRKRHGEALYIKAAKIMLLAAAAFLFARAGILGELYPFAPAFLGAVIAVYPRKGAVFAAPVLLGIFSVMDGKNALVYSAICLLITMIFLLYTVDNKKQWFVVPGMVIASVIVSKGLLMALTIYTDHQLVSAVFESAIAGGLSLVFLSVFTAIRRFDVSRRFSADEIICIFLAVAGLLCGLNGTYIGIIDVQSLLSRVLILFSAYLGGCGAGAAVGALVGIVPSVSQVISPTVIAAYTFSGLLAGVFANFGRIGTAIGFILGNMILALYIMEPTDITAGLLTSAIAALIFCLIPARAGKKLGKAFSATGLRSAREEKSSRLLLLAVRRLRNSGWMFRDISNSLLQLTESAEDSQEDCVRASMEQLSHQLCSGCSLRDICWELDYQQTFRGIVTLFEKVRENGTVEIKDTPDNFARRCPHMGELIATVNCLYDMQVRNNYWQTQKKSAGRLIGCQLAGVAEVLDKVSREICDFGDEREMLERELEKAVSKRGLPVDSAGIISVSERSVSVWAQFGECPGDLFCRQAIEDEVSRLLGRSFSVQETVCGVKDSMGVCRCEYHLLASGAYGLSFGKAQLAKDGKSVCGDSSGNLLLEDGRELMLISDGMGCGEKAAEESSAAISLISRLLEAGFHQSTAIDMLNSVLALRGEAERFVTLDICVLDRYDGKVDFIKTGGAASYIKRGGVVKAIAGSSLPVGMLNSVDQDIVSEQVFPGDMIIMASDGLLDMDSQDEGQWLSRVIGQAVANDPQVMAEYLLDKVISISGGKLKDDITVMVAQVGESA